MSTSVNAFLHPAARLRALEQGARKRFGQNFLVDPDACGRIARAAGVTPGDAVLEIGPGLGALTDALLAAGGKVTAIELDRDLAAALRDSHPQVRLVEGDALKVDLDAACPGAGWKVAANLPYNVGTLLLLRLAADARFVRLALMFQREVADRIVAGPDDDAYGALSVQIQARLVPQRALTLPPGAFHPAPKVHSTVLRFDRIAEPDFGGVAPELFDRAVRLGFSLRRKKLVNALASGVPKEAALAACQAAGIDPGVRAEVLGLPEWRRLAASLAPALSVAAGAPTPKRSEPSQR